MQGDDAREVQQALTDAGIEVDADGVFGPGTEAAVIEFQKNEGLTPDGVMGAAIRSRLGVDL